ncbi:MAG: hypothetical protein JWR19_4530 [Pedosphaera sp.]|nr:hypothetical protein [Pedosphaera sp.]
MASEFTPPTSFSARRKWSIILSVLLSMVAVTALVVMANYLGSRYFMRFAWSTQTRTQLSPQTLGLLKSVTNDVKVIVYYDREDKIYNYICDLLAEYHLANPKIAIEKVDYVRDAAAAQKVKDAYKDKLTSPEDKNLVIFDSGGRTKIVPGKLLSDFDSNLEQVQGEYRHTLKSFRGEMYFSPTLLSLTSAKPLNAFFLTGHGEHNPEGQDQSGYSKFKTVLQRNYVLPDSLQLLGTNAVPADCNLLVIAGPQTALLPIELDKVKKYLDQGGRMLVLFNERSRNINTGLEPILADWGVDVGHNVIRDPANSSDGSGLDLIVSDFNPNHPLTTPLLNSRLQLALPRSVGKLKTNKEVPDAPKVEELAFSGDRPFIDNSPVPENRPIPLMVAVEKGNVKGVFTERGSTRIVVIGESFFLNNHYIDGGDNSGFAGCAVNWLLDQTQLLQGVGPHPVTEYLNRMTRSQMQSIAWLFLAAMPGGILLLGSLVWLRRRH